MLHLLDSSLSVSHIRFDSEDETMEGQEGACLISDITDDFNSTQPYSFAIERKKNDKSSSKKAKQKVNSQIIFIDFFKERFI